MTEPCLKRGRAILAKETVKCKGPEVETPLASESTGDTGEDWREVNKAEAIQR